MEKISVPNEAIKYILFQRTEYLISTRNILYKAINKLMNGNAIKWAVFLESITRKKSIREKYSSNMYQEFLQIRPFLPETCESILDIGCGIAGIDAFINNHYNNSPPNFHLLDKTQVEKNIFYMFKETGAFYNCLKSSKKLLNENDISYGKINLHEANKENKIHLPDVSIDIIISLISWGFHYPLDTYLEEAYRTLKMNGILILDIRKDSGGENKLINRFHEVSIIHENKRSTRFYAVK